MMPKDIQQASLNHTLAGLSTFSDPQSSIDGALRPRALLEMAISLIDSALDILGNHIHSDEQLRHESILMPGGTAGKHFRHVSRLTIFAWNLQQLIGGVEQVIETFQAFLLPLKSPSSASKSLTINYDAILPESRKPLARSVSACQEAMSTIREDLIAWGDRHRDSPDVPGGGVAGETGRNGLAGQMRRQVDMIAMTPTKQDMRSSVGREVS